MSDCTQDEALFSKVFESAPLGMALIDSNGRLQHINTALAQLLQCSPQALLGMTLEDLLHPQDRERCAQVFNRAFEAREPYSMEYRLRRHDGVYRWLHEQGKPRHDADQRFIGYIGSCLDVTDLREAEATARERDATLQQVFDVLKDMLFVLDAQEHFVFFHAGSEDRLYRRPEEFLGQPMATVMPPALVAPLREAMQRAREHGIHLTAETTISKAVVQSDSLQALVDRWNAEKKAFGAQSAQ